jgi:ligand-binding sensor domain-containing protein/DNA-binding CsgD family transcriptional regulator
LVKKVLKTELLLGVLMLIQLVVAAQPKEFAFDHLGVEDGLSNPAVTAIYQDNKGFMWFGTYNGLNRYDGYEIKSYFFNQKDSLSLGDNRVTCIFEDDKKNIWVGTNVGGLNLYNRSYDNFIRYTKEASAKYRISSNKIETIFQDSKGNLWVGTNDGLNLFDYANGSFKTYHKKENDPASLNSNTVYSILERGNKELIVLTNEKQLNKYSDTPEGFLRFAIDQNQSELLKTARFLFQDKEQNIWIGTLDDGILKYNNQTLRQYHHEPGNEKSLSHNLVKCMMEDDRGNLWVGTDGGGLNVYNASTDNFTAIKADLENRTGLNSNAIYSLYQDRSGTIWVGTFGGGVNVYNREKSKFIRYGSNKNDPNSLSHKSVLALLEDHEGNVWIGTDGGGLNLFNRETGTFKHFRHDPSDPYSISSDVVKSLYEDSNNNLWVGTYLGGLNLFDKKTNRFYPIKPSPPESMEFSTSIIWDIHEDSHNNLWLATLGNGLCIYHRDKQKFTHFQPFAGFGSLGDYNIISMLTDSEGNLWIGTEDRGINLYDYKTGHFKYLRHDSEDERSLSSDHAWALFEDSNRNIWVGTSEGLNLFEKESKTFRHFTTEDGLAGNIINNILEDLQGNLWITSDKGLTRFNPQKGTFKNYDVRDGLQSNDFNGNSAMRSRNGDLFFGGINGFNIFTPTKLKENPHAPPVVLTDFQIFNKPVKIGANEILQQHISETHQIVVSYKESVVSFKFAALNYISPEKNLYAYKMEGFEQDWNYSSIKREVTYTNLDPGTYTFKVKAANNDGVWNEAGTSVKFIVTPPWWETVWFKTMMSLTLLSAGVVVYKIRTRNIRNVMRAEKQRELEIKEAQMREERLKHEKAVIELSRSKLESEINSKNSELATTVMSAVKQNETLLKIKEDLTLALKEQQTTELTRQLKKVMKVIDQELKPDEAWNQFELLFNQIHENFLQKLKEKYPELTSRDLKLCAYLRMNLNSKEIAPLLSLSVRGVEDLRYRVRKKMGLDTNVNLAEFVLSL